MTAQAHWVHGNLVSVLQQRCREARANLAARLIVAQREMEDLLQSHRAVGGAVAQ